MKMILRQLFKSLSHGPVLTALIIISFAAGLTLAMGSVNYYAAGSEKLTGFYTAYDDDEYRFYVQTLYVPGSLNDTSEIKRDLALRANAKDFEFYFLGQTTMLEFADYRGPDNCLYNFGKMVSKGDRELDDTLGGYLSFVSSIQLSGKVFDKFALRCAEGEAYTQYDNLCPINGADIPVVLGSELRDAYRVGDTFKIRVVAGTTPEHKGIPVYLTCRVSGILAENSVLIDPNPNGLDNDGYIHLDYMVMLPVLDWVTYFDTAPYAPLDIHLINQTSGVAVSRDSQFNFSKYFSDNGVANVQAFLCMRVKSEFVKEADAYFANLAAAGALILICTSVCLAINLSNKLMAQIKAYAVHLISGATLSDINIFMISEASFIAVISALLALAASAVFSDDIFAFSQANVFSFSAAGLSTGSVLLMFAAAAIVVLLALAAPLVKLNRTEFDTLLRGKE